MHSSKLWLAGTLTAASMLLADHPAAADVLETVTYVQTGATSNSSPVYGLPVLSASLEIDATIATHVDIMNNGPPDGACPSQFNPVSICAYSGDLAGFVSFTIDLDAFDAGGLVTYTPALEYSQIDLVGNSAGFSGRINDDYPFQATVIFTGDGATIGTDNTICFNGCTSTGYFVTSVVPTPEPTVLTVLLGGLTGLVLFTCRKSKRICPERRVLEPLGPRRWLQLSSTRG